ncbi:MAG: hypothetical protein E6I32_14815 [Chloroflexi bacterium]|nr:MAG: hypothetical protein E6I32_14815 [Chloroflexota bacterium]
MSRLLTSKRAVAMMLALALFASMPLAASARSVSQFGSGSSSTPTNKHPICNEIGTKLELSSGARMWCFGPQFSGSSSAGRSMLMHHATNGSNVDAANPAEDVSQGGVQAFGQAETSIGSVGPYVVEAWNDATGFFAPCPSPMSKEELTGFAFSSDGGKTFQDQGGLPNSGCASQVYAGDPSVEAWQPGGQAYFYISSLFPSTTFFGINDIALAACHAVGTLITCGQPVIVATSSQCQVFSGQQFCSFLDKDFLSIDPVRGRLYMSYSDFRFDGAGQVDLAVCDIGTPSGGIGPLGGTAMAPICNNGSSQSLPKSAGTLPYFTVAPNDPQFCENEGAYPSVDVATGDVYVAYEHNWATNIFGSPACRNTPTMNVMNYIPFKCLATLTLKPSSCTKPAASNAVSIVSLDAAFIPGYNRFPMNDFPRPAVSDSAGTITMVWNDGRFNPAGDILLYSFTLGTLVGVQAAGPVVLNTSTGGWHMMPALRNADADGNLSISFYGRASANTDVTDVFAAIDVSPTTTSTPASNVLVTTAPSAWSFVSADSVPNFGDYTDNYIQAQSAAPYTTEQLFVAWTDGRLGDPQPFSASSSI